MQTQLDRRDPYNQRAIWENWKQQALKSKTIEGISSYNSKLILRFLTDMELGQHVAASSKKGHRSFVRLNALRHRLLFFGRHFRSKQLDKLTKHDVHVFFLKLRRGEIQRQDGKTFRAVGTLVKDFKAFWHYLMRIRRTRVDITTDLSRQDEKPPWVYLTEDQFKALANRCIPEYRALLWLMYDSMARVTEAYSIKVKDFSQKYSVLEIRPEVSKTFGRKFKLKLCGKLLAEYVKFHNLQPDDFLFQKTPAAFNKYLKRLARTLYGEAETPARARYSQLTLYDIRHNSTCFWLMRYPSRKGVMYRGGWTKEEQLNYYSEFLGLSDQLSDEDMVTTEEKTRLQRDIALLKERLAITTTMSQLQVQRSLGKIKEQEFVNQLNRLQEMLARTKEI